MNAGGKYAAYMWFSSCETFPRWPIYSNQVKKTAGKKEKKKQKKHQTFLGWIRKIYPNRFLDWKCLSVFKCASKTQALSIKSIWGHKSCFCQNHMWCWQIRENIRLRPKVHFESFRLYATLGCSFTTRTSCIIAVTNLSDFIYLPSSVFTASDIYPVIGIHMLSGFMWCREEMVWALSEEQFDLAYVWEWMAHLAAERWRTHTW